MVLATIIVICILWNNLALPKFANSFLYPIWKFNLMLLNGMELTPNNVFLKCLSDIAQRLIEHLFVYKRPLFDSWLYRVLWVPLKVTVDFIGRVGLKLGAIPNSVLSSVHSGRWSLGAMQGDDQMPQGPYPVLRRPCCTRAQIQGLIHNRPVL